MSYGLDPFGLKPACGCRSMFGLLQLLPQSDAFKTLSARLQSAPTMPLLHLTNLSANQLASSATESVTLIPAAAARRKWQRLTGASSSASINSVEQSAPSSGSMTSIPEAADIPWTELLKLFCKRQVRDHLCVLVMSCTNFFCVNRATAAASGVTLFLD